MRGHWWMAAMTSPPSPLSISSFGQPMSSWWRSSAGAELLSQREIDGEGKAAAAVGLGLQLDGAGPLLGRCLVEASLLLFLRGRLVVALVILVDGLARVGGQRQLIGAGAPHQPAPERQHM